ncbi:hypothetical protein [uncultured Roseobacter sp.]|uniref:hypothetical protein n=1 Tax=uncultured Roseobacter sp. TaxID=114847 RepID=UPI00260FB498|nr:hypothetical protein [uncultured Roseobacter sp.]
MTPQMTFTTARQADVEGYLADARAMRREWFAQMLTVGAHRLGTMFLRRRAVQPPAV